MTILYSLIVLIGLGGVVFGFWGQQRLKPPYDNLAAVALPLSLILGLGAALLLCVPDFFSGLF
ncbi:MAG: hypothetical protein ACE5F7_05375 [Nitrospiria bacterium]